MAKKVTRVQTGRLGDREKEGMELKRKVRVKRIDKLIPFTKTNDLVDLYLYRKIGESGDIHTYETNLMFASEEDVDFAVVPLMDKYEQRKCLIAGYGVMSTPDGNVITVDIKPMEEGVGLGYGRIIGHLLILPYRFNVKIVEVFK